MYKLLWKKNFKKIKKIKNKKKNTGKYGKATPTSTLYRPGQNPWLQF